MNRPFDWHLVPTFLAALDQGSLMGAARQLGITQPTAGRHLAELEQQLGTVLFERTGRGLQPTAMAVALADAARTMAQGAATLERRLQGALAERAGPVRLTASQPVACVLLPPVLRQMQDALPDVQVELVVSNALSNLLEREADIALRMVRPDQGSLVAKRIAQVRMTACASLDYLERHGTPEQPADLLKHRVLGLDRSDDILKGFAALGHPVEPRFFVMRTDDLMAYWSAVGAGLGVGFVARYMLGSDARVRPLLPGLPLPSLPMWLTAHREVHTSPRIRAVFDFLAQALPLALHEQEAPLTRPGGRPAPVSADTPDRTDIPDPHP